MFQDALLAGEGGECVDKDRNEGGGSIKVHLDGGSECRNSQITRVDVHEDSVV